MANNSANGNSVNGKSPRVAIVCDWLTGIGGAERVVLELHKMYPDAPIYTSQYDPKKIDWFIDADVRTLWLQKLPKSLKKFFPLLRAMAFKKLDLSSYGLVISSSGAEAKYVRTNNGKWQMKNGKSHKQIHIAYVHAPTHYYWSRYDEYLKSPGFGFFDPLARLGLKLLVGPLRRWDYKAAQRPDYLIANSTHTHAEIKKYYGRDSQVIFPPVDTARFGKWKMKNNLVNGNSVNGKSSRKGFVIAGRQTPYKMIDLAVTACTELNLPLTVIGDGPDHAKLINIAGPTINFDANASDKKVAEYFATAEAFIFPGIDDFGIVAVEAMASGTPVIAYKAGGALDYVKEGVTGLFFEEQSSESLAECLKSFDASKFDSQVIKDSASQFSSQIFHEKIHKFIQNLS